MSKRQCWSGELLSHDVISLMLERLSVKRLLRCKGVCTTWKSTIESRYFQEAQLFHRRQSRGPDVLFVSVGGDEPSNTRRIVLGSSSIFILPSFTNPLVCRGGYDGLVLLYGIYTPSTIINPATRMVQSFPLSTVQGVIINMYENLKVNFIPPKLGFGRDKISGIFKPVWLYNSSDFGLDSVTTCEVFDFSTNAWRFLVPSSSYRVLAHQKPVCLDGSLYWLTECKEPKVVSLDLHAETFGVISATPFAHVPDRDPRSIIICTLGDRLCVSEQKWPNQTIWWLDSSGTWQEFYSLDLSNTVAWFRQSAYALLPVAIVGGNKLVLHGVEHLQPLVAYDILTGSFDLVYEPVTAGHCVEYFQSLFSV